VVEDGGGGLVIRPGGDRWEGLCTERVILNKCGQRRKWIRSRGIREIVL